MIKAAKRIVKSASNVHRPDGRPNVFLYSTPRSGSTWLMELIWSQPGFKTCNQALYLENPVVRKHLGISEWDELYSVDATEKLRSYLQRLCDGASASRTRTPSGGTTARSHTGSSSRRSTHPPIGSTGCATRSTPASCTSSGIRSP